MYFLPATHKSFVRYFSLKPTRRSIVWFGVFLSWIILGSGARGDDSPTTEIGGPRIVNIYNFIRNSDYRLRNSREVLFDATRKQIELIKPTGLPATWALQYDALINPRYQKLLKEQLGDKDEIAAWDGYTFWGGYGNQAYYPNRLNAYMPAQTKAGQIDRADLPNIGNGSVFFRLVYP
jgi:hypothetical protein